MSNFAYPLRVLTAGSMVAGGGAYAQSMYDINQRQDYQQDRIDRGVRDGQITRSEQYRLEQGERQIDRAQARAMADGHVTPQERARIDRMTDRESREIYQQSHDRQQSWDRGQQWGRTDGNAHNGGATTMARAEMAGIAAARATVMPTAATGAVITKWQLEQGRDHNGWNGQNNGQGNGWNHGGSNGTANNGSHTGATAGTTAARRATGSTATGTGTGTANNGSHNWGGGGNHGGSTGTGTTGTGSGSTGTGTGTASSGSHN